MKGIIMSGCTTLFPGLHTRLKKELIELYRENKLSKSAQVGDEQKIAAQIRQYEKMIRVDDPPNRKYTVFQGAVALARMMEQNDLFLKKAVWDEHGAPMLKRKGLSQ